MLASQLTSQLQQLGLTEGEAKVYEALVAVGPCTVGPVVKRSGVAYSNIYDVLQRLTEKGLASYILKEKTKHFSAIKPTQLGEFLARQEEQLLESKRLLEKILPQLQQLQHLERRRIEAEVFIGAKAIMTAYDHMLDGYREGETIDFFYQHDPGYFEQAYSFYRKLWIVMRKKKVKGRGIVNNEYKKTKMSSDAPRGVIAERYVDFPVPANIDIGKSTVLIATWGGMPTGILIHSEEVARNFQQYFEAVWKVAKP